MCTVEYSLITRNKFFFLISMHISMLHKSSLWNSWTLRPIIYTPYAASVGMSRDRFLALLTMFHPSNNDAEAAKGQPGYDPLFKIWPVIDTHNKIWGHLHTRRIADYWQGNVPILRVHILSCLYHRKAPQIWNKNVLTLWGKRQLCPQPGSIYTSHQLRTQRGIQCCWQVGW
jgi:hypothetical protein